MAVRLKDLRVVEVSLVNRPANKTPLLLLRAAGQDPLKIQIPQELVEPLKKAVADGRLAALLAGGLDAEPAAKAAKAAKAEENTAMTKCPKCGADCAPADLEKGVCPKCGAELKEAAKEAAKKEAAKKSADEKLAADLAVEKTAREAAEKVAKDATDKLAAIEKAAADDKAKVEKTAAGKLEAVEKAASELKAQVESLTKEATDAKAKLASEVVERKRRDAVAKAAREFPHLDGTKVVSQLIKAEGRGKEDVEELDAILKQAEALAKSGGLGTERGSSGEGSGSEDAWARIEKAALARVEKSDRRLTKEQAISEYLNTPEGKRAHGEYQAAQQ